MPVRIVDVVLISVDRKLVVDAEDFGFAQPTILILLLFELLQFQVSAETLDDHKLGTVVLNVIVSVRLERALFHFFHVALPTLSRYPRMLLLELDSDPCLLLGHWTVSANCRWHSFILPRLLGVRVRLEGTVRVHFGLHLLLSVFELFLRRQV